MAAPTSAIRAIEAAIVSALIADSTFTTRCPGGVVSFAPPEQVYPYVILFSAHEQTWNTMGGRLVGNGRDVLIRLHVFSRYEGDREALLINERMIELLDHATVTVSGYDTVLIQYLAGRVLVEDDADKRQVRHIPAEFRVRVHE
jgi:Protein of unknown function (DUF3168)